MQLENIPENIAAMQKLLAWYETGENEPNDCPLCVALHDDCTICPWIKVTGNTCLHRIRFNQSISKFRVDRDSIWIARRIPELKRWIAIYEAAL